MKIKGTQSAAGVFDGESFSIQPGEEITVPDALGDDLIRAGYAEAIGKRQAPKAEKRVQVAKETRG
jgi:hypothetical protein